MLLEISPKYINRYLFNEGIKTKKHQNIFEEGKETALAMQHENYPLLDAATRVTQEPGVIPTSFLQKVSMYIALIFSVLAIRFAAVWPYYTDMGGKYAWSHAHVFSYHPVMMVTAHGCFILGGLAYRVPSIVENKAVHGLLHVSAVLFASIGIVAVFLSHDLGDDDSANLYSMHGWLGLSTYVLTLAQSSVAIGVFAFPCASMEIRRALLPYHRSTGQFIIIIWAGVISSGIVEKTGFLGICSYDVTSVDSNPASNYKAMPDVCHTGQWIGIFVLFAALFASFALVSIAPAAAAAVNTKV